jgi:hypothetical protein
MATTQSIIDYYKDLLILQYKGKPKSRATIDALVKMAVCDQLPKAIQDAFNLETAEGVQLDVVGTIVGATRYGFDFSGPVTLDDEDFREFIRLCIVQNSLGSSLKDVQDLLAAYFPGIIYVFDHLGMRINYYFDSDAISSQLAEFFVMSGRLPKPIGVQLGAIVYLPSIDDYFGYTRNDHAAFNTSGFSRNTGFVGKQLRNGDFL